MTTLERLDNWKQTGTITADQHRAITAIVRKDLFSVFLELNGLLYLGVLSFVGGLGWMIQAYAASFGDIAVLSALTILLGLCFYYCLSRALPYSPMRVESPNFALDYVLYLACLIFATELGYVETRFHLLQNDWDVYLLFSVVMFFVLAYRFDNRFVLSLALSALAAWLGVKVSRPDLLFGLGRSLEPYALVYSAITAAAGTWLYRLNVKKHFTETYYHVAALVALTALSSGVFAGSNEWIYVIALCAAVALVIVQGVRRRKLVFVVYAIVYGYVGVSMQLLRILHPPATLGLAYFVVSAALVVVGTVRLSGSLTEEERHE